MKLIATLALIATMLAPTLAAAMCDEERVQMTCADGLVFDQKTRGCVPVTG